MKTWYARTGDVERKWWLIDAKDQTLGRMATQIANILRGKHKPQFTPNSDAGDFVVVINAEKIKMTGKKWAAKKYYNRSRFFGSLKEKSAEEIKNQNPSRLIFDAVKGMLPTNKLSKHLLTKLKMYKGADHPHAPQRPETLTLK